MIIACYSSRSSRHQGLLSIREHHSGLPPRPSGSCPNIGGWKPRQLLLPSPLGLVAATESSSYLQIISHRDFNTCLTIAIPLILQSIFNRFQDIKLSMLRSSTGYPTLKGRAAEIKHLVRAFGDDWSIAQLLILDNIVKC